MNIPEPPYTAIIRWADIEYVAICLELNVSAGGKTIQDTLKSLQDAIDEYIACIRDYPDTFVQPIPIYELVRFLQETSPVDHTLPHLSYRAMKVEEIVDYA
jgi:predicted RNase H-like HicB family nuclease